MHLTDFRVESVELPEMLPDHASGAARGRGGGVHSSYLAGHQTAGDVWCLAGSVGEEETQEERCSRRSVNPCALQPVCPFGATGG